MKTTRPSGIRNIRNKTTIIKSLVDFINEERVDESVIGLAAFTLLAALIVGVGSGETFKSFWNRGLDDWDRIPYLKDIIKDAIHDKKLQKIADKYKDDPEVQVYAQNPKMRGWQAMLQNKLDPKDLEYLKELTRKYFKK